MKINEAAFGSELVVELGANGNGHGRAQSTHDERYQAAFKAGLASGQEAGYRQGYQAGFADGLKQTAPESPTTETGAGATSKVKNVDGRAKRLRGLPCVECGVSMYSDETTCRCCGTVKGARHGQMEKAS